MTQFLALTIGSVAGGFARYFLGGYAQKILGPAFPFGTLAVNLTGCFLIGLFSAMAGQRGLLGPTGKLFLMTGFCGAFTTFSTFMLEADSLTQTGGTLKALLYIFASVAAGFLFFKAGLFLGAAGIRQP